MPDKRKSPSVKPFFLSPGSVELTEAEWRTNPDLQKRLKAILSEPVMQAALSVCDSLSPSRQLGSMSVVGLAANMTVNGVALSGMTTGYEGYRHNLLALARPQEKREEIEASYGAQPEGD